MSFFSGKKLLLLGFLAVLLAVIPLTVYFLQTQTKTRIGATPSTTLSFSPSSSQASPITKTVGEQFNLDIMMNPGSNQVIATTLSLTFDAAKLQIVDPPGLAAPPISASGQGFTSVLAGPTYTPSGTASITLTVGVDVTKAIKTETKVATITFKPIAESGSTPVQVAFDRSKTNVTSVSDPEVDVLSINPAPAFIAVANSQAPSPTATPTTTTTPTPTATTGTPTPTPTGPANQLPTCTALNVDRTTSGSAPFSITFTANGNDPNGTINKVTFDFGDGPVQDTTQGGGIGTKTVSVQLAHTYNNTGTYSAKALLTDNSSAISKATDCVQTITVTAGAGGVGAGTPTVTPTIIAAVPSETPPPGSLKPGPDGAVLGVGALGIILTILGAFLFFAL